MCLAVKLNGHTFCFSWYKNDIDAGKIIKNSFLSRKFVTHLLIYSTIHSIVWGVFSV